MPADARKSTWTTAGLMNFWGSCCHCFSQSSKDGTVNSAGSPKRNAARQQRVRDFYGLMEAITKTLTPRERAELQALGNAILAESSPSVPAKPRP